VRKRLSVGLIPAILGSLLALATPSVAMAADGLTETATTTYQVLPATNVVHVTIALAEKNTKKSTSCGAYCTTNYYWDETSVAVEAEAGSLKASSNKGSVRTSLTKSTTYYKIYDVKYPPVYYGQTRTVTISYDIPAGPGAPGGFRALQAYAHVCMMGNGYNSGAVQVVLPKNLDPIVTLGKLPNRTTPGDTVVLSSGSVTDVYDYYWCVEAQDNTKFTSAPVTAGSASFTVQAWPEDTGWAGKISADLTAEVKALTDLTGLTLPAGPIAIQETADSGSGGPVGWYDSTTKTVTVSEMPDKAAILNSLSRIWFNDDLFTDTWAEEGFAAYSEKAAGAAAYTPCKAPGAWPGSGSPDLTTWSYASPSSSSSSANVADYQYAASCYIITTLAEAMGPESFKAVVAAAVAGETAYPGSDPHEKSSTASALITSKKLLDLIDERGMVPGGVEDLDQAQDLMARYGVFSDTALLEARSKARATYHGLADAAGKWALPVVVRQAMTDWDFTTAATAMKTAQQILDLRKGIESGIPGFSLDGTDFQKKFEAAQTQADLDAVLALFKTASDAGTKVAEAAKLHDGGLNPIEMIGLLGVDTNGPLDAAKTALAADKTDDAKADAQNEMDAINGSMVGGLLRLVVVLVLLGLCGFFGWWLMRRRRAAALALATAEPAATPEAEIQTAEAVAVDEAPKARAPRKPRVKKEDAEKEGTE
jgi:hypothetical protein